MCAIVGVSFSKLACADCQRQLTHFFFFLQVQKSVGVLVCAISSLFVLELYKDFCLC